MAQRGHEQRRRRHRAARARRAASPGCRARPRRSSTTRAMRRSGSAWTCCCRWPASRGLAAGALGAASGRALPQELSIRRRSGEMVPVEIESSIVEHRGRRMIVLVVRDLTGRQQTEETLRSLAYHDPLTGLPNRLLFHDRLAQAIERARRARQMLTVMLVDLDRFKLINNSLGLETGDQIIKGVADRLVQTLAQERHRGPAGRRRVHGAAAGDQRRRGRGPGGAEGPGGAAAAACRSTSHELPPAPASASRCSRTTATMPTALIKNADNALSRAKEQGRNHYQFYTDDMNATAFERLMLESRLRQGARAGRVRDPLPAQGQPRGRRGRSGSRRCCAGSTRTSGWCRRPSSSRWPRRPG